MGNLHPHGAPKFYELLGGKKIETSCMTFMLIIRQKKHSTPSAQSSSPKCNALQKDQKDEEQHAEIKLKIHLFNKEAENTHPNLYAMKSYNLLALQKRKQKELYAMQKGKKKLQATPTCDNFRFKVQKCFLIRRILIVVNLSAKILISFVY